MKLTVSSLSTPLGPILLATDAEGQLHACEFVEAEERMLRLLSRDGAPELASGPLPAAISDAFDAYFGGEVDALDTLPVCLSGPDFHRKVWAALREIPAGRTESYGDLAARIGRPGAARAVGLANHENPCQIVVPCHRVVAANGALTGYAGGIGRKRWLLEHEARDGRLPGF